MCIRDRHWIDGLCHRNHYKVAGPTLLCNLGTLKTKNELPWAYMGYRFYGQAPIVHGLPKEAVCSREGGLPAKVA